ncbi:MAG: hypothetical protein QOJ02_1125 [Acidobacteriota bacterium]|jgi:hypothetical protein|nr:hypothetical protein [Acidobacteriota bacterium]
MNCRNFEATITELARGQMLEARAREDALAHVEVCKHCATRYADEQALTAGLRAVAASASLVETPARVEAALLSAFRQGTTTTSTSIDAFAGAKTPRWSPWSIAAAATILVVSAFAALQFLINNGYSPARQQASSVQSKPHASPTVEEATGRVESEVQPGPAAENQGQTLTSTPAFTRPLDRRHNLIHEAGMRNGRIPPSKSLEIPANTNEEIATDFLPLTYGSDLTQLDNGQVVRVELPRSVLQSFGIPINADRAGERVKADVLLGHDGVARAIRFIR